MTGLWITASAPRRMHFSKNRKEVSSVTMANKLRRQERIGPRQQQQIGTVERTQFAVRDDELMPQIGLLLAQLGEVAHDLDPSEAHRS